MIVNRTKVKLYTEENLRKYINDRFNESVDFDVEAVTSTVIENLYEDEHSVDPQFWRVLDKCIGSWLIQGLVTYDYRSGLLERK